MGSETAKIVLRIDRITKIFESGTEALATITVDINDGGFAAVVGPSGCGKSTLLRIISGLLAATSGTILRGGTNASADLKIGFVFQDPTFMPWATVANNVALPLNLNGLPPNQVDQRVDEVLAWVGLESFKNAYPRELSGGMRMRASIARALTTEPDLLLLDEPFAALDEFTRGRLNEDLLSLWQTQHWTGVFVTHSIREAAFLSDRIIVLSSRPGRVVADVSVPFSYPRSVHLRDDHAFTDLCATVSGQMARAITDAA